MWRTRQLSWGEREADLQSLPPNRIRGRRATRMWPSDWKVEQARLSFSSKEARVLEALDRVLVAPYSCFRPGPQPARVCDGIYLAGLAEATDPALLRQRGITRVLSCVSVSEIDRFCAKNNQMLDDLDLSYYHAGIEQRVVEVLDSPQSDIAHAWEVAQGILCEWREQGHNVLVHCVAGHNRSAAIVMLWLMHCHGMRLVCAAELVQSVRGCVLSNHSFRLALVREDRHWAAPVDAL